MESLDTDEYVSFNFVQASSELRERIMKSLPDRSIDTKRYVNFMSDT